MPKHLMGSLVIAPAELPPQALPPAVRRIAMAAREPDVLTPKTASRLMEAQLGTFVHPFEGPGFKAQRLSNSGGVLTLSGRTLSGRTASVVIKDPLNTFLPKWAVRLAAALRNAGFREDVDQGIKEIIQSHNLPVDQNIDWGHTLHYIFSHVGLAPDDVESTLQEAIFRALIQRDMLSDFDPERQPTKPLEKRVTSYVLQLMEWQARGEYEAGGQARDRRVVHTLDAPAGPKEDTQGTLGDLVPDEAMSPQDITLQQSDVHDLKSFKAQFSDYVRRYKTGKVPDLLLLAFELITTSHDGAEVSQRWGQATGTSYSNLRKTIDLLRTELTHFANARKAPGTRLTRIIQEIKARAQDASGLAPETLGQESVGPKAVDMQDEKTPASGGTYHMKAGGSDRPWMGNKATRMTARSLGGERNLTPAEQTDLAPDPDHMTTAAMGFHVNPQLGPERAPHMPDARSSDQEAELAHYLQLALGAQALDHNGAGYIRWEDRKLPHPPILIPHELGLQLQQLRFLHGAGHGMPLQVTDQGKQFLASAGQEGPTPDKTAAEGKMVSHFTLNRGSGGIPAAVYKACKPRNARPYYMMIQGDPTVTWLSEEQVQPYLAADGQQLSDSPNRGATAPITASEDEGPDSDAQWDKVQPRPIWDEAAQFWTPGDKTPGGLLGGQPVKAGVVPFDRTPGPKCPDCGKPSEGYAGSGTMRCEACRKRDDLQEHRERNPKSAADTNDHRPEDPEPAPNARAIGAKVFDPELHDPEAELSITYMSGHLESQGISDTSENMHDAVEGFNEARDAYHKESSMAGKTAAGYIGFFNGKRVELTADSKYQAVQKAVAHFKPAKSKEHMVHVELAEDNDGKQVTTTITSSKESSMSTVKYAAMKRIAAEDPSQMIDAVKAIQQKLQAQVDNLTVMLENMGGGAPATPVEGDPATALPVPGAPVTASEGEGFQQIAEEAPDQVEEALGEFYTGLDEILAMTENLADNLDVTLPSGAPVEDEDAPEEVEVEDAPEPEPEPASE